jgi:large subunit ribosomal protein L29
MMLAILKISQIRQMSPEELGKRLSDLRLELAKESGAVKMGRPVKNSGKIGQLRKTIARISTVQTERRAAKGKADTRK